MAAIEPARYTILKKMKLTDFTPQIAVSPTAVGVGGGEPRGGALQPLTSPSPSAPEVRHHCTARLSTATPPSWSSSSPRAPLWMLPTVKAKGPGNGQWGGQGVEWRDDVMQSEKEQPR